MALEPGQRVDVKKRIIATLLAKRGQEAEIRLVFDEFDFPPAADGFTTVDEYVRTRLRNVGDADLLKLDRYLHPDQEPIAALLEGEENTGFTPEEENRPFMPAEQAEIARVLGEIKQMARESWTLDLDQARAIETGIDYLIPASLRLGRKDWLMVVYTVLGTKVLDVALEPNVAEKVASAIVSGLGALFGHRLGRARSVLQPRQQRRHLHRPRPPTPLPNQVPSRRGLNS